MNHRRILWVGFVLSLAALPWAIEALSRDEEEALSLNFELHDAEGFALMGANASRDKYRGTGVSIALVDSGIDISHPAFGGTTNLALTTNEKVVGSINFTTNPISADQRPDTSLISELHGTSVAGIIAGFNVGDDVNYIGGVAPDALIYSAKVVDNGQTATSNVFAAWQWALDHQWDDPDNPIVVINNSLALTALANGFCDSLIETLYPGISVLIDDLNEAGITLVASSGNNGSCEAMPFPACHSNIISVSAVFDADFPSETAWRPSNYCAVDLVKDTLSCQTATNGVEYCFYTENRSQGFTAVAANTAPFLDLFAPSYQVVSTDFTGSNGLSSNNYTNRLGQTSASAAYAAGAVALLQSAARAELRRLLTADEVRQLLTESGTQLSDSRLGSTFPLIDLDAAVARVVAMKPKSIVPWMTILLLDD